MTQGETPISADAPPARRHAGWVRFLPIAFATLVLAVWAFAVRVRHEEMPESALIGRPAPSFALPLVDRPGEVLASDGLRDGKPLVLNIWASWCTVCVAEAADLQRFADRNGARARVIGIAVQDTARDAARFARENGMRYTLLLDESGRVGIDFGILGVPETFVIDGQGVVRKRFVGVVTLADLESALADL